MRDIGWRAERSLVQIQSPRFQPSAPGVYQAVRIAWPRQSRRARPRRVAGTGARDLRVAVDEVAAGPGEVLRDLAHLLDSGHGRHPRPLLGRGAVLHSLFLTRLEIVHARDDGRGTTPGSTLAAQRSHDRREPPARPSPGSRPASLHLYEGA